MLHFMARTTRKTAKGGEKLTNTVNAASSDNEEHADTSKDMAQANGINRESTPVDTTVVPPGRVISTSMMRQGKEVYCKRVQGADIV